MFIACLKQLCYWILYFIYLLINFKCTLYFIPSLFIKFSNYTPSPSFSHPMSAFSFTTRMYHYSRKHLHHKIPRLLGSLYYNDRFSITSPLLNFILLLVLQIRLVVVVRISNRCFYIKSLRVPGHVICNYVADSD